MRERYDEKGSTERLLIVGEMILCNLYGLVCLNGWRGFLLVVFLLELVYVFANQIFLPFYLNRLLVYWLNCRCYYLFLYGLCLFGFDHLFYLFRLCLLLFGLYLFLNFLSYCFLLLHNLFLW